MKVHSLHKNISPKLQNHKERGLKVKVKLLLLFVKYQVMVSEGGCILDLYNGWRWSSVTSRPLHSKIKTQKYPNDRKLSGPKTILNAAKMSKICATTENETRLPGCPALPNSLYDFSWINCFTCISSPA